MLSQIGIFFALLSDVILDHPEVTDKQSQVLGFVLVAMALVPVLVTALHLLLDPPSGELQDELDNQALMMLPGAARIKRTLENKAEKGWSGKVAPETTSQTQDCGVETTLVQDLTH